MSYRNVDTEAYKKAYANKNKKKKSTKKVLEDEKGKFEWELVGPRHRRKKKYLTNFSDVKAKAKKDMTSNKAYPLSFGETFKQSKAKGEKTFRWKNKQYHTKTKDELEKATKERSERFPVTTDKKKAAPAGKEQRQILKRVKWMEKRKEAGKGYSAKNLAELTKKLEELNIR